MCPLNSKGKKIMNKMREHYGTKKGTQVFHAMEKDGQLEGVIAKAAKKKKPKKPAKKKTY